MRLYSAIMVGICLAVATVVFASDETNYCGQQWPRLFAASLCGRVEPAGGAAIGRSIGSFTRGSNRSMQQGGIASPTWTELVTDQAGSWEHTDGHDYAIIEGVQVEMLQNNWFTFEDWPAAQTTDCTAVREASTWGPGGQAMRVNFTAAGGKIYEVGDSSGLVEGDWVSVCAFAWVESGTLPIRVQCGIGASPQQVINSDVILTTTPTEYCIRAQHDGTSTGQTIYIRLFEDPVGDGTGVDFLVGYFSAVASSVQTTPIKNHTTTTFNNTHAQREADVLPFSTTDLSVEEGEGHADVAWLDYAYDWPATPTSATHNKHIVVLSTSPQWRIYYERFNASLNRIIFAAGGASILKTITFSKGDVTRLEWRWRAGVPLELCVDGTCKLSSGNYTPPASFDASGCWGSHDCTFSPIQFLDGGLRNARIR